MPETDPPKPGRYIDPLVDFSFKKIFGTESNKDILIAFLNEIFKNRKHIVDLVYNKNEHYGDTQNEGSAIFDLLCTGDKGERFVIELQRAKQGYFKERALFYTSRLISEQAPKGKRSEWAYNIAEVYFVALLEDFTLEGTTPETYLHNIALCNTETGEIFYNKLGYTYIELSKFDKSESELGNELEAWLYSLLHMPELDEVPSHLKTPIFEKLFGIAEYTNLSKEEKTMYDNSLKYKWDNKNVLDYAVQEAEHRGIEKGIEKGEHQKAIDIARELKSEGLGIEFIAKTTKLSIEEIKAL
ncbi:Rpn family recombination-promoting nuclease/putative transposase [Mucilaginibacter pedocola]|uniref:Transposase n=1 Tax=Mucilaginibacter pedocola TaxID=1792845 RepID=A0A1S9P7I8_9SPHI|nr:Rpn family recombination-promoting nuclease/putative transposase [Mucilaginibacter pedocola]OOQ56914.1 hypothetical protein BC343_18235 [Mucilaginibacter pedocola]